MTTKQNARTKTGAAGSRCQFTRTTRPNQPETSLHAWEIGLDSIGQVQTAVLQLLAQRPMNDDELHAAYLGAGYPRRSRQRVGTARHELAQLSLVVDTGERRASHMGNPARVWAINPKAVGK